MRKALVTLLALAIGMSGGPTEAQEAVAFDVARYQELHESDRETLELILGAMREAVFYAQHSIGQPVICATPIPIAGPELIAMVDEELGDPTNPEGRAYGDEDQLASVLVSALKRHGACR